MKRLLVPLAVVATAALLLSASVRPAYACSCVFLTPRERVEQADLALIGTVGKVTFERPQGSAEDPHQPRRIPRPQPNLIGSVHIDVERYLKGGGDPGLVIEQGGVILTQDEEGRPAGLGLAGGPSCALFNGLPVGERYLLFLHGTERGTYETGWCSGSIRLDASTLSYAYSSSEEYAAALADYDDALGLPDRALLGVAEAAGGPAAELPSLGTAPSEPDDDFPWLPIIAGSALGAAGLAAASPSLRAAA